jgi:hypothetical protein
MLDIYDKDFMCDVKHNTNESYKSKTSDKFKMSEYDKLIKNAEEIEKSLADDNLITRGKVGVSLYSFIQYLKQNRGIIADRIGK